VSDDALKLTAYFGERARARGRLLADELLDAHARHAIRLSVLLRGVQGFGAKHRLRSDRLLTLSEDLPLVSIAIDARERIDALARELSELLGAGLMTLERARLGDRGRPPSTPYGTSTNGGAGSLDASSLARELPAGSEVKLTVCIGRHERVGGEPAFAAVCRVLREAGVSGATALLGVDGTVRGERRRARFFARNMGVPLLIVSVGEAERITRALATLAQMLPSLLFTIERVRVCKRDGELLRPPGPATSPPESSQQLKLTIVVSEAARHEGRPLYLELVRRLRADSAAGATSLRGIWGFHGEHAPHGDRLLSLRRHVPVVTELIDTPVRVEACFEIVDELTREHGLVTSETLPRWVAAQSGPAL
jgi:PII-like signaling protein